MFFHVPELVIGERAGILKPPEAVAMIRLKGRRRRIRVSVTEDKRRAYGKI
jgi:hypothetical protein